MQAFQLHQPHHLRTHCLQVFGVCTMWFVQSKLWLFFYCWAFSVCWQIFLAKHVILGHLWSDSSKIRCKDKDDWPSYRGGLVKGVFVFSQTSIVVILFPDALTISPDKGKFMRALSKSLSEIPGLLCEAAEVITNEHQDLDKKSSM